MLLDSLYNIARFVRRLLRNKEGRDKMRLDTEVLSAGVDDERLRCAKRKLCSGLAKNDLLAVRCALHEYRAYKFCFNKDVNFQTHVFTPEHCSQNLKKTNNYTKKTT